MNWIGRPKLRGRKLEDHTSKTGRLPFGRLRPPWRRPHHDLVVGGASACCRCATKFDEDTGRSLDGDEGDNKCVARWPTTKRPDERLPSTPVSLESGFDWDDELAFADAVGREPASTGHRRDEGVTGAHRRPSVFISYAWESEDHVAAVEMLARLLRDAKIGVVLDRWVEPPERRIWPQWFLEHLDACDFVIAVGSPSYRRAAAGTLEDDEHRGVQWELLQLQDRLQENRSEWTRKILPVVLPGRSVSDIPDFLLPHIIDHYKITHLSEQGLVPLLNALGVGVGQG